MPISAAQTIFESAIAQALEKEGGSPAKTAGLIASGLSSGIPMGMFIACISPFPLPPAGVALATALITAAFNLGSNADPQKVATLFSVGISLACPMVPPAGMSSLKSSVQSALEEKDSTPQQTAKKIAQAIVSYYSSSGVVG